MVPRNLPTLKKLETVCLSSKFIFDNEVSFGEVEVTVSRGSAGTAATCGRTRATTENLAAEPRTKPGNLRTQSKSPTAFCSVVQAHVNRRFADSEYTGVLISP